MMVMSRHQGGFLGGGSRGSGGKCLLQAGELMWSADWHQAGKCIPQYVALLFVVPCVFVWEVGGRGNDDDAYMQHAHL